MKYKVRFLCSGYSGSTRTGIHQKLMRPFLSSEKSYRSRTAQSYTWCSFSLLIWKDRLSVEESKIKPFLKMCSSMLAWKRKRSCISTVCFVLRNKNQWNFLKSFILTRVSAIKTEWPKVTLTILSLYCLYCHIYLKYCNNIQCKLRQT